MAAPSDYDQMRWFQLRAVENIHEVESENLDLRRKVVDLESKSAERQRYLSKCVKELKEEIKEIKSVHSNEIMFMNQSHNMIKKALEQLSDITYHRKERMVSVLDENERIVISLDHLRSRNHQENLQHQSAIEKYRLKVLKLKDGISECEAIKGHLRKDREQLRSELATQSSKIEGLNAEILRLRSKNFRTESESQVAIAAAKKSELNCRLFSEEESALKNSKLVEESIELQNKLAKLKSELTSREAVPHFAKFVQLKSENVALKSQLTSAGTLSKLARTPPMPSLVPVGGQRNSVGNLDKLQRTNSLTALLADANDKKKTINLTHPTSHRRKSDQGIYSYEKMLQVQKAVNLKLPEKAPIQCDETVVSVVSPGRHSGSLDHMFDLEPIVPKLVISAYRDSGQKLPGTETPSPSSDGVQSFATTSVLCSARTMNSKDGDSLTASLSPSHYTLGHPGSHSTFVIAQLPGDQLRKSNEYNSKRPEDESQAYCTFEQALADRKRDSSASAPSPLRAPLISIEACKGIPPKGRLGV